MNLSPAVLKLQWNKMNDNAAKYTYSAAPSVSAGHVRALVDLDLAVVPREARLAGTGVAALPGVGARGSVHAGLVVSAVVQIYRKKQQENTICKLSSVKKYNRETRSSHTLADTKHSNHLSIIS